MNEFSVQDDIIYCRKKVEKLNENITDIEHQLNYGDLETAKELTEKMMKELDRLCIFVRDIPLSMPVRMKDGKDFFDTTKDKIATNLDIQIGYADNKWFCVRLPIVAPKINGWTSNVLYEPLYLSLEKFADANRKTRKLKDKRPMVICYRFVYGEGIPIKNYHDHDNKEVKMITDAITTFTTSSDSPHHLNNYYCSATGEESHTEVFLIPREEFAEWLKYESTLTEKGVILTV